MASTREPESQWVIWALIALVACVVVVGVFVVGTLFAVFWGITGGVVFIVLCVIGLLFANHALRDH